MLCFVSKQNYYSNPVKISNNIGTRGPDEAHLPNKLNTEYLIYASNCRGGQHKPKQSSEEKAPDIQN